MTNTLLRQACKVAGLRIANDEGGMDFYVMTETADVVCGHHAMDPALPAYVASLLVARVRELRKRMTLDAILMDTTPADEGIGTATEEQRIRAALAVLTPEREGAQ